MSTIPLHFIADYCLRCGTPFTDHQSCPIVKGGPDAKYHAIGLCIDEACLRETDLDIHILTVRPWSPGGGFGPILSDWPRYFGPPGLVQGYAKVSMLDNGVARVGLHRGHVEHWSRHDVFAHGDIKGSYSHDYGLYGPDGSFYHQVIETRFYDLARPLQEDALPMSAQNAFVRGRSVKAC